MASSVAQQPTETRYTYSETIKVAPVSPSVGAQVPVIEKSFVQPSSSSFIQQSSFPTPDSAQWSSQAAFKEMPRESLLNQVTKTAGWLWSDISSNLGKWTTDLSKNIGHLRYEVTRGVGKVLHSEATAETRFRTYFGLPPQEQLLAEFQCKFLHTNNTVLEGFCYISYNYFCFAPLITFARPMSSQMLLITIPLRDIDSIQPAVASASYIPSVPTIQPITNPLARPDAMQLITKDRNAYNFFGFIDCMHAFNVLFHAWKSCDLFSNLLSSSGVGLGAMGVGSQLGQTGLTSQLSGGNISQIGK